MENFNRFKSKIKFDMPPQYSIAISPPDPIIQKVSSMKQKLEDAVGYYSSRGSKAHITFNMFDADEKMLKKVETFLCHFVMSCQNISVHFDHFGHIFGKAFVIVPDKPSESQLKNIMTRFHNGFPLSDRKPKFKNPHISIGRNMKLDQLKTAVQIFDTVHLQFICTDLVIRKFNDNVGQYDIYKRFAFSGIDLFSGIEE